MFIKNNNDHVAIIENENLYVSLCVSKQDQSHLYRDLENTKICVLQNKTIGIITNIISYVAEYFKPSMT